MSEPKTKLIEIENATVYRGGREVFVGFSLGIAQRQNTVILGPNGAGKSTLLKLITSELYPARRTGARVEILGRERWNVFELRKQLGVVSHELQVQYHRDVRGLDVLLSGFYASIGVYPHQSFEGWQQERAQSLMAELGVSHLAKQSFVAMSAGEQRRFLLGRSLINDPHTLLLDEPTTSLDLKASIEFLAFLRRLMRRGKTLVLITHHVHEIPPEVTWVVLLRERRILAQGERASVLTSENLTRLYGLPLELVDRDGYCQVFPR